MEYIGCTDLVETELWHASQSILEGSTSRKDFRKDETVRNKSWDY